MARQRLIRGKSSAEIRLVGESMPIPRAEVLMEAKRPRLVTIEMPGEMEKTAGTSDPPTES